MMFDFGPMRRARDAFPWCRICRRPVWRFESFVLITERRIEYRTLCHGVPGRAWLDEESLLLSAKMAPAVYELAPRQLEAIRPEPPPRVRGRRLAPEPAGFFRVLIPPPPSVEVRA